MPLYLNEEQSMLRDTARGLVADIAPVSHLRRLRDGNDAAGWSKDVWQAFADMGLPGLMLPDEGLGLGAVEAGIVLEELGRNLTPSPFLGTSVGGAVTLRHATAELRAQWSQRLLTGQATVALALDEGSRHAPTRVETTAEPDGNGIVLSGTKSMVVHGHTADLLIVSARSDQGLTLVAVETDRDGIRFNTERWVDSSWVSHVTFDDVQVPATHIIGQIGDADGIASLILDHMRAGAAAELVGVARAAFERTVAYLQERVQFDRVIGTFQALQHRAAALYAEIEMAYAATLKAQQLLDADDAKAHSAAIIAKAQAGLAATLAVQEAVQMHGGIGMTDEHDIGLYMKRARVLATLYGHADDLADQLAREAGY